MPNPLRKIHDDIAYILPMAVFLLLTGAAGKWPDAYPLIYLVKTILTAAALVVLWPNFTKIRWNHWWLGLILGVVGIFQWIGMQLLLQKYFPVFRPSGEAFNPLTYFHDDGMRNAFIVVRLIGAVLVVPVMEELFWRDFLWRQILAPNDFKLAAVGEWGWAPFLIVAGAFSTVHGNWMPTAIVWGLMIGALLVYTKSLGACIIMHGTTNLLLGLYVLHTHDWSFW
jgi:CAAX prenyl protease-like protein